MKQNNDVRTFEEYRQMQGEFSPKNQTPFFADIEAIGTVAMKFGYLPILFRENEFVSAARTSLSGICDFKRLISILDGNTLRGSPEVLALIESGVRGFIPMAYSGNHYNAIKCRIDAGGDSPQWSTFFPTFDSMPEELRTSILLNCFLFKMKSREFYVNTVKGVRKKIRRIPEKEEKTESLIVEVPNEEIPDNLKEWQVTIEGEDGTSIVVPRLVKDMLYNRVRQEVFGGDISKGIADRHLFSFIKKTENFDKWVENIVKNGYGFSMPPSVFSKILANGKDVSIQTRAFEFLDKILDIIKRYEKLPDIPNAALEFWCSMKEEERVAFYRIHCFMDLQTSGVTPLKFMGCGTRQRAYLEDDNWIGEYLNKPGFYKISHSMGDGNCFYWSYAQGLLDVEKNAVHGRFTLIPDNGGKEDETKKEKEDKLIKLRQLAVGVRTVFANNIKLENYQRRAEPLNELRNFRHLRSLTRRIEAMMHPMKKVNKLLLLKTRESRLRHVLLKFDGIEWGNRCL